MCGLQIILAINTQGTSTEYEFSGTLIKPVLPQAKYLGEQLLV